jgi:hypothetical protein
LFLIGFSDDFYVQFALSSLSWTSSTKTLAFPGCILIIFPSACLLFYFLRNSSILSSSLPINFILLLSYAGFWKNALILWEFLSPALSSSWVCAIFHHYEDINESYLVFLKYFLPSQFKVPEIVLMGVLFYTTGFLGISTDLAYLFITQRGFCKTKE